MFALIVFGSIGYILITLLIIDAVLFFKNIEVD